MRLLASLLLLLTPTLALPQDQAGQESCRDSVKEFYNSPPISTLPSQESGGIIHELRPELQKAQAIMGYDSRELTAERLASLLRYTELAKGKEGERIAAITYRPEKSDPCGNHGQCPTYLMEIGPHRVRALDTGTGDGASVGGTWGAAVSPRAGSVYPDLLVLSTVGPEVLTACYRWQGTTYQKGCNLPCAKEFNAEQ